MEISDLVHKDPVAAAIISNLCRSAPFLNISQMEVDKNRMESWEKEILAATGPDRVQVLDYDVWFSDDPTAYKRPISKFVPPAPVHNARIRAGFRDWRNRMAGKLLFPQVQSQKTMSRATAARYTEVVHHGTIPPVTDVTSADIERIYMETGIEIGGPCELRQAWKYNDITPRTYFTSGGTAFHASKYIRDPINLLTNSFPEVNFVSRFSMDELAIDDNDTVFIYDYTSFTSLLAELKYFLDGLADFCDGTEIFLVDSNKGIIRHDLGMLLREYNQTCNIKGEYTVNRYEPGNNTPLNHRVAGFLGVYGNIAISTTLHGLHACQLCGDQSRCRCVGDDVFGVLRLGKDHTKEEIIAGIESLGKIHRSKVKWWPYREIEDEDPENDRAYTHLKRPLDRFGNKIILEPALFSPIWGLIHPIDDILNREVEDIYTRAKLLASQSLSAIKQARSLYPPLELHQKDLLQLYLQSLYEYIGFNGKGCLPFESTNIGEKKISDVFVPNIEDGFLDEDPWVIIAERWVENTVLSLPEMVYERQDRGFEVLRRPGTTITTTMNRTLAYLQTLGLLEAKPRRIDVLMEFEEYSRFYTNFLDGQLFRLYDVKLVDDRFVVTRDLAWCYESDAV